ncbi:MAG: F420-0--gamma-glutamyl ligase [Thermotogae bacterium]|nr:F420-0--gamma-glutamyl ligase [Thermotogota bacterium]
MELQPNPGKSLTIDVDGEIWARYPIRTHVIRPGEDIVGVAERYAKPHLREGDYLFVSEKVVAIAQGRAYPIDEIRPSLWARLLSKFVTKSPHGIGLGSPWTMELAIREAGLPRILLAASVAALTKPLGIRGMFYRVAGRNVAAIDGPTPYTLPPYNRYAKLPPKDPDEVARRMAERLGVRVVIVDANDLGVEALGLSDPDISVEFVRKVFRDNPLGQASQRTPLCVVRRVR